MLICAIGSVIISYITFNFSYLLIAVAVFIAAVFAYLLFVKRNAVYSFCILLMMLTVLSSVFSLGKFHRLNLLDGEKDTCKFTVYEITSKKDRYCTADIKINESNILPKGTKLSLYYYFDGLNVGDTAEGELKLEAINPKYLKNYVSRNIMLSASCSSYVKGNANTVLKSVNRLRKYIESTVFSNLESAESATLCALLSGNTDYFTDEFYSNVKGAGVSHIMVVSGMHLSITVALFIFILEKFLYNRYVRAVLQIAVTLLLCAICGFTMSIIRAGIMFAVSSVALIINRKSNPESSLSAAVVLILLRTPFAFYSVALRLSVLSTFGILSVALPISEYIFERGIIKNKLLMSAVSAILVTLSATLLTLPVTISVFGYVSTVSVISNLLISYAVTLTVWLAIIALILNLISPFISGVIFFPGSLLLKYINGVINTFGSRPFSTVTLPPFAVYISVAVIIAIFYALLACKKRTDMLKLEQINEKILREGGGKLKWQ